MRERKLVIVIVIVIAIVRSIHSHRHVSFHHDTETCRHVYTLSPWGVNKKREVSAPPTIRHDGIEKFTAAFLLSIAFTQHMTTIPAALTLVVAHSS